MNGFLAYEIGTASHENKQRSSGTTAEQWRAVTCTARPASRLRLAIELQLVVDVYCAVVPGKAEVQVVIRRALGKHVLRAYIEHGELSMGISHGTRRSHVTRLTFHGPHEVLIWPTWDRGRL